MKVQFHILVVDDEPMIADAIVKLLQAQTDLSAEVYCAYRGYDALAIFDSTRIDLLLSDIRMPDMTGLMLLDAVNSQWPACKTIFLTGYSDFDYAYQAISKHAAGYILKSEDDDVLLGEVRRVLSEIESALRQPAEEDEPAGENRDEEYERLFQRLCSGAGEEKADSLLAQMGFKPPYGALFLILGMAEPVFRRAEARRLEKIFARYLNGTLIHMAAVDRPGEDRVLWLCQFASPPSGIWLNGLLETIQNSFVTTTGREVSFLVCRLEKGVEKVGLECRTLMGQLQGRAPKAEDPPFIYMGSTAPYEHSATELVPFLQDYVAAHIREDISIAQISAASGYNGDYLSRLYRQSTGKTLGRYIADCRLTYIRHLMRDPDRSLDAISRQTGFSSRSYFNRFIKRETGQTPQQLQAQELKEYTGENENAEP